MDFYVNGEKIDITIESEKTVSDILKSFEAEAAKNEATTIGIKVNGEKIPAEEFDSLMHKPLEETQSIELNVLSKASLIDALKSSKSAFVELEGKLKEVPVLLQGGKEKEANAIIADFANNIDEFCHNVTMSALFPELYSSILIDGKAVSDFFEEFAPIIADFEQSMQTKDIVTSGDLCEYEIAPRLGIIAAAIDQCISN